MTDLSPIYHSPQQVTCLRENQIHLRDYLGFLCKYIAFSATYLLQRDFLPLEKNNRDIWGTLTLKKTPAIFVEVVVCRK